MGCGFLIYMLFIFLIIILVLLLGIAFVTLFERHLLALSQNRKAPRKPGVYGIVQPVYDGFKLFKKEVFLISYISELYFLAVPLLTFCVILLEWGVLPYFWFFFNFEFGYFFFCVWLAF